MSYVRLANVTEKGGDFALFINLSKTVICLANDESVPFDLEVDSLGCWVVANRILSSVAMIGQAI